MITPEQLAKPGTEHAHQAALFCWASMKYETYPELRLMFAIPNGGLRDKITAARLKATGVKAGVPDIFLPVAIFGRYHGLFIEMKADKGTLSVAQSKWCFDLRDAGYEVVFCYGWEQARDTIIEYLNRSV